MRTSIVKVVLGLLSVFSVTSYGAGLADYEATCLDLGFKKRTPAYGECVLELDKRSTADQKQAERARGDQQRQAQEQQERLAAQQRQQQEQQRAARGDGTPDHSTCAGFGFTAGTTSYSECRMRVAIAKREEEVRRQYEIVAAEKAQSLAAAQIEAAKEARQRQGVENFFNALGKLAPPPSINCMTTPSMGYGLPSHTRCQ